MEKGPSMPTMPHVLIVGGFLGAGKTTLLLQLIRHIQETRGTAYRIAVIENELGSVSIDADVIGETGYTVTNLLAGCICCTLLGELVPSMLKLVDEVEPHLIILEMTGIATPESIRETIDRYGGFETRTVSLADASRWARIRVPLHMLLERQLSGADIICINKIDLVDEEDFAAIHDEIRGMNPTAPLIPISASGQVAATDLERIVAFGSGDSR